MQAIIMAAGFGSRLGKVNKNLPKSFLEINNEKLINRAVRLFEERGINEIIIVTGYKSDLISLLFKDKKNIKIIKNPLYFCTNVLGSFACAMNELTDDFIFLHADTIFDPTILDDILESGDFNILPIDFKACQQEEMKVITNNMSIINISKEIPLNQAEGEFLGLAKFNKNIISPLIEATIEELKNKKNYHGYFEAALQALILKNHEMKAFDIGSRKWIEIDFPEDYKAAKEFNF